MGLRYALKGMPKSFPKDSFKFLLFIKLNWFVLCLIYYLAVRNGSVAFAKYTGSLKGSCLSH